MQVTLCALNSQYIHSALAPWCLASGLETFARTPVNWRVVEGTVNQTKEALLDLLGDPGDLLCLCCYIWNWQTIQELLPRLKEKHPRLHITLGGPEVSFRPLEVLHACPQVDFVLSGEGERSVAALVDALAGVGTWDEVAGLSRRTEDGIMTAPPARLQEPPPSPYLPAYFSQLNGRIAYLETSRGCPFSCAYCLSGRDDPVRFFPLDYTKEMLLRLANAGCHTVKLVDRTFNCDPVRAREIWHFLIENAGKAFPHNVCFHFEIAADLLREEELDLLATAPAGLFQLEAGIQSFHAPTLEAVSRRTDLDRLCRNVRRLLAPQNIHIHVDLIAGLPLEDINEFSRSFDRAFVLRPHMLQLGFLKLLYGSRLRQQAEENAYTFCGLPPYEFDSCRWMSAQDKVRLHAVEDALDRMYNSGRFLDTVEYALQASGLRPFDLFDAVGRYMAQYGGTAGIGLEEYTARLQACLLKLPNIEPERLRDALVTDCLCSSRNGRLPSCLEREDARRLKLRRLLLNACPPPAGGRRAVAILYGQGERAAIVDYTRPHPLTGRFRCQCYPLSEILADPAGRYIPAAW